MNSVILNRVNINKFCIVGTSVNIFHDTKIGKNCIISKDDYGDKNVKINTINNESDKKKFKMY